MIIEEMNFNEFKTRCQLCKSTKDIWLCDIANLKPRFGQSRNEICRECMNKMYKGTLDKNNYNHWILR